MMTAPARIGRPLVGAFGAACAAVEAFARTLAAEVGPYGVRVVCLRSRAFQKTPTQVARDLGGCILWPGCGLIGVSRGEVTKPSVGDRSRRTYPIESRNPGARTSTIGARFQ